MKRIIFLLLPAIAFLQCDFPNSDGKDETINPLIKDASFVDKFGRQPNAATDEDLRIKTHLEYVENFLRQKTYLAYLRNFTEKDNACLICYIIIGSPEFFPATMTSGKPANPVSLIKIVDACIETSGFSKEECAMIQPTYGPPTTASNNYIKPSYGIASSVAGGLNVSLNTINAIRLAFTLRRNF